MNAVLRMHKTLGIVFIALLVLSAYLTYAVFTKKFASYEEVTLRTSNIGLQLPQRADVKVRGVIVGEVLDFRSTEAGAEVTLGLYPDKADLVDRRVTGSILPKTLFGEKYVSLVPPGGAIEPIRAGAVIEKSQVSVEVERVLSDLYPLLTAVQPDQLNLTLTAVANALEGRGELLGENLETLDSYLKRFNPELPTLVEDLRKTAEVSDVYADVLPEVATILDNTITTTQTLETREQKLNQLFRDVAGLAGSARVFLDDNEDNLVRFAELSTATLRVLSRYSSVFPCLAGGLVNAGKLEAEAFRNYKLHIVLETLPRQPRAYDANDVPVIGENRGPNCLHLPNPPWSQSNPNKRVPNFNDGVNRPTGKGTSRVAPEYAQYAVVDGEGYVGSAAEAELYRSLVAPTYGVNADEVDDLGSLLLGPMARGATVTTR
ncbi:MCE family protein [Nocardioides sp. R-C-SC26]|uniref:MCE family protein n=1 Tax=Nocardioides sp. R-C-SC26 TaxID=2870414 RepID=UPI001E2FC18B|nr:MCE family protein [Nocardioides sp. R-C-SC26]